MVTVWNHEDDMPAKWYAYFTLGVTMGEEEEAEDMPTLDFSLPYISYG